MLRALAVLWLGACAGFFYLGVRSRFFAIGVAMQHPDARRETARVVGWNALDDDARWGVAPRHYVYAVHTGAHGNCSVEDRVVHTLHEARAGQALPEFVSYYWAPECRAVGVSSEPPHTSCLNDFQWAACQASFVAALMLGYAPLLVTALVCAQILVVGKEEEASTAPASTPGEEADTATFSSRV